MAKSSRERRAALLALGVAPLLAQAASAYAEAPAFGDRRTHQMDPPNVREALVEVTLDLAEDTDMVMVKPADPYLDAISAVRAGTSVPVAAYQVSGEFSMIEAAAQNGWDGLDWRTQIEDAWSRLGEVAVQGNLDPAVLLTDPKPSALKSGPSSASWPSVPGTS